MKKLLFFALLVCMNLPAGAADSFSTLEERMSGKEFRETGLEKLTDEELAALNAWVRSHSVATLDNAVYRPGGSAPDDRGFEHSSGQKSPYGKVINSSIVGAFDGWSGDKTEFILANGMVWKQAERDSFYIKAVENPEIVIEKGMLNSWRLRVVGYNKAVLVRRIQ